MKIRRCGARVFWRRTSILASPVGRPAQCGRPPLQRYALSYGCDLENCAVAVFSSEGWRAIKVAGAIEHPTGVRCYSVPAGPSKSVKMKDFAFWVGSTSAAQAAFKMVLVSQ